MADPRYGGPYTYDKPHATTFSSTIFSTTADCMMRAGKVINLKCMIVVSEHPATNVEGWSLHPPYAAYYHGIVSVLYIELFHKRHNMA